MTQVNPLKRFVASMLGSVLLASHLNGASAFTVEAGRPAGKVSPRLYGLMTEEINHGYDGGLYAELIRNRAFNDDTNLPVNWSAVGGAAIALDRVNPLNEQLTVSLRLDVASAAKGSPAGVANEGYWGIPVQPQTTYRATLWAKAATTGLGPLVISIVSADGATVYAAGKIAQLGSNWSRYGVTLKTGKVAPTDQAKFAITLEQPGTVWLGMVSLFPPTWNDRPNGLRKDLMQMLVDLKPKFLRFPGGNYLEGNTIDSRFEWKKTLGPIEQRPGHMCPWGYRSSDGMGMMEFLHWSEDMGAESVLAVYAGYSLNGKSVKAGPELTPYVQDALDEIEYVVGDVNTTWGAQRAKDGHPAPFNLHYVEIGNEDWFDKAKTYDARYTQFHDAIKAKYPQLKLISTIGNDQPEDLRVHSRKPDMTDEHYYSATDEFLTKSKSYGQKMDRSGAEIFVGEWAAHEDAAIKPWDAGARKQPPTPTMKAAIGDAVFMAAMERNADIIKMHCYAPLLVNVNPGARQWRPDLIGYNAISSYGSPSYYTIQMFSRNVGDEILPVRSEEKDIQGCATRNSQTGEIFIKLVNPGVTNVTVNIEVKGASLAARGEAVVLQGSPEDTNSINHPRNVVPVAMKLRGVKAEFPYTMSPQSIVLLKLKCK